MFAFGIDILNTVVNSTTKTILAQTGSVTAESPESDNVEWWQHVGFLSRPPKPAAKQAACQGVVIRRGDHDICVASRDLRGQDLAGSIGDGESCMYAAGEDGTGQARFLLKGNGNAAIYTTNGNVAGGSSVTIQANSDGSINLASEYGGISISSSGIMLAAAGGAGIQLGSDGAVTIIGTSVAVNGGSVSLGANAAMPVIYGPSGVAGAPSTSVKVAI